MSREALNWFFKAGPHTQTGARYALLHALCLQDPSHRPGEFFKPNLSEVGRRTPVRRQTASKYLSKLEAAGFIERRAPRKGHLKSSIRLCLDTDFSDVIDDDANDGNVNQRRQSGVTKGDSELTPPTTETVTAGDTTYKQEQGSGVAIPQPEPDPCSTNENGRKKVVQSEKDGYLQISCEKHAENLRFFRQQSR